MSPLVLLGPWLCGLRLGSPGARDFNANQFPAVFDCLDSFGPLGDGTHVEVP